MLKITRCRIPKSAVFPRDCRSYSWISTTRSCSRMGTSKSSQYRAMSSNSKSIFGAGASPWDHIFKDLDPTPKPSQPPAQPRRQTMTESERQTILELLESASSDASSESEDLIFSQRVEIARGLKERTTTGTPSLSRKHFSKTKDVEVDELREQMGRFESKTELLRWAREHVFKPFQATASKGPRASAPNSTPGITTSAYSKAIPMLMLQFRERFSDPHLALAVYKCVKTDSIMSYVYGCTSETYNELIITIWESSRDLKTIREVLEEMKANSVAANRRTEAVVERVCREATNHNLWLDRSPDGDQLAMAELSKISEILMELLASSSRTKASARKRAHDWKLEVHKDANELDFGQSK